MKRFTLLTLLLSLCIATTARNPEKKTAIVAQCGYWDCEGAGFTQESIGSLTMAQKEKFWGSEMDIHITSDDVVIVHHDSYAGELDIASNPYSAFDGYRLENGECLPTFDNYLKQTRKFRTVLVVEIKTDPDPERHKLLVNKTIELARKHRLLKPDRIVFISHSLETCSMIAEKCPGITVQILSGGVPPQKVHEMGINGIDYNIYYFQEHPEWVAQAHELGMTVHVWGVDTPEQTLEMTALGVDMITTMNPVMVRQTLQKAERLPR